MAVALPRGRDEIRVPMLTAAVGLTVYPVTLAALRILAFDQGLAVVVAAMFSGLVSVVVALFQLSASRKIQSAPSDLLALLRYLDEHPEAHEVLEAHRKGRSHPGRLWSRARRGSRMAGLVIPNESSPGVEPASQPAQPPKRPRGRRGLPPES